MSEFNTNKVTNKDLLYPDLSFKIVGILFEVYNALGYGYQEKYYQKAIAALLRKLKIEFTEQVVVQVMVGEEVIAEGRADFIIEEKLILEIKKGDSFRKDNIDQLHGYLKSKGLIYKRIVNIRYSPIRNS